MSLRSFRHRCVRPTGRLFEQQQHSGCVLHNSKRYQATGGGGAKASGGGDGGEEKVATGLSGIYGAKGADAYRGMLTQNPADALAINLPSLPGKATKRGTKWTVERSSVFENWHSQACAPSEWYMSKLGCTTCKMSANSTDSIDALQLQIVKGLNVFMLDSSMSEAFQHISRGFSDCLTAFELDREGFVFCARAGLIRGGQPGTQSGTGWELNNIAVLRRRFKPTVSRVTSGSFPSMSLKSGFNWQDMTDEELRRLKLRRVFPHSVAATSPEWLEAALTNMAAYTALETVDVFFIEGLHVLLQDPETSPEDIDKELVETFKWCESQVAHGVLQYYGISSGRFFNVDFKWPEYPADAMIPHHLKDWKDTPHKLVDIHRIMRAAEKAGGKNHHMRFISYPFNLTMSGAINKPLDYDPKHTVQSLARHYGLTIMTTQPLEAHDMQRAPQRYHRWPLLPDLATGRLNFFNLLEKVLLKEREIQGYLEKLQNPPNLSNLLMGSVYVCNQRQFSNVFHIKQFIKERVGELMRQELTVLREGAVRDIKDWANNYESLVVDLFRHREMLFEHKHALKGIEIDHAIDRTCPKLKVCPIISQKAMNFATYGGDVCLAGFHESRYFHEATELNPAKNGGLPLTNEEVQALANEEAVTFLSFNPPHPYMMEPPPSQHQGKISGQQSKSLKHMKEIDLKDPEWPDIPKNLDDEVAKQMARAQMPEHSKEAVPQRPATSGTSTTVHGAKGPGSVPTPLPVKGEEEGKKLTETRFF